MAWDWIDWVIVAIVGLSVITGLFRGFIKEFIALCVWILAIWLAYIYSDMVALHLKPYLHDKTVRMIASFLAIVIATLIAGGLINALLSFILVRSGLSGTDRLLGMFFGFVRGVFIVALVFLVLQMTSIPYQEYVAKSHLYPQLQPFVNWLSQFTPELINKVKVLDNSARMKIDTNDIKPGQLFPN